MVVDGGIIVVIQPIQMADTTGVDTTPQKWQNMEQMMELYGWIGKDPGIHSKKRAWSWDQFPSLSHNDYLNK